MDRNKQLQKIEDDLMSIFRGLMCGNINYTLSRLHSVMGADICTLFDEAVGDFVLKVDSGKDVSDEELCLLYDNLVAFKEDFEIEELDSLIEQVNKMTGNSQTNN